MKKKAVVLLSGGIDSTTLMYALVADYEVWPLNINYGQRHSKELIAARGVCAARGDWLLQRWQCLDLSNLSGLIECVLHGKGEVPNGPYSKETLNVMVSPNRNMILLAIAAGYAQSIEAEYVAYAPHRNDAGGYPDCRPEFVESVKETILFGTGDKVTLITPFVTWSKAEVVRLGRGLNVPFVKTYSCYKGGELHCGKCPTCIERKQAFELAMVDDPTVYGD